VGRSKRMVKKMNPERPVRERSEDRIFLKLDSCYKTV
jgi:hypothetical protein